LANISGDQLQWLEIMKCPSVTNDGLLKMSRFEKLKVLRLEDLKNVYDPKDVLEKLQQSMPKCSITYPPFTNVEDDNS
jgi:hypothetical protein